MLFQIRRTKLIRTCTKNIKHLYCKLNLIWIVNYVGTCINLIIGYNV